MKPRARLAKALISQPLYPNLSPAQSSDPKSSKRQRAGQAIPRLLVQRRKPDDYNYFSDNVKLSQEIFKTR